MGTYRLFPSTSGPTTPVNYSGDFVSAVVFTVSQGGCWFEGYWWWVCPDSGGSDGFQNTTATKCALWSVTSAGQGVLVPGSVVTSGTLTAGQWNYIPLTSPLQLAPGYDAANTTLGSCYVAAIGCNGPFPDTSGFWGTGGPGVSGITQGPLFAFSGDTDGGTELAPWSMPQGVFSDVESDPSAACPGATSTVDNFWVDVQVSDTAPAGYAGSYRLWPNKWDANSATTGDSAVAYNIATEVDLSEACMLGYAHYFVPPDCSVAAGLATRADVWDISTGTRVASIASPAWTTESGGITPALGSNTGFWVRAAFAGGVTVPAGDYRVSVYNANGASGAWNAKDAGTGYFTTGVAADGITNGPVSAPSQASAQPATFYPGSGTGTTGGQPVFAYSGSDDFPDYTTGTNPAQVYWVDLEVTPLPSGLLLAAFP